MKTLLSLLIISVALALGGCDKSTSITTATVSTVKPQQAVDLMQSTHRAVLRGELIYLNQPPCALKTSPRPPLCASYAVGAQMKALDDKFTLAIANAQRTIDTLGSNPAAVNAAIAAAQLALDELQAFTTQNGVRT